MPITAMDSTILITVIRIAGKYLRSFGFEIGTEFQIDLEANKITITKLASL